MPTVPTNNVIPMKAQPVELPPMEYLLMAGATMGDMAAAREEQSDPFIRMNHINPHTIQRGPEYDKWDEALEARGAIRVPKDLDEPQKWMNQHNKMFEKNNIQREDQDDGSVILRKIGPTS